MNDVALKYQVYTLDAEGADIAPTTGPIEGLDKARGEYRAAKRILESGGFAENVSGVALRHPGGWNEEAFAILQTVDGVSEGPFPGIKLAIPEPEALELNVIDDSGDTWEVNDAECAPTISTTPARVWNKDDYDSWEWNSATGNYFKQLALQLDDDGIYPRVFRAYSHEEWVAFYAAVAGAIAAIDPETQHGLGVYIEEQSETILILKAKRWKLTLDVPAKTTAKGKTIKLEKVDVYQKDSYSYDSDKKYVDEFTTFLWDFVHGPDRDLIFDILCQYHPHVRFNINRTIHELDQPMDLSPWLKETKAEKQDRLKQEERERRRGQPAQRTVTADEADPDAEIDDDD